MLEINVLVSRNFDDDSIKNEKASMDTPFPIISLWDILDAQGWLTAYSEVGSGRNSNSCKLFWRSLLHATMIRSVATKKRSQSLSSPRFPLPGVALVWQVFLEDVIPTQTDSEGQQNTFIASFWRLQGIHLCFPRPAKYFLCNLIHLL